MLPWLEILEGVEEVSVAVPPLIDKLKSPTSRAPDPELVSKTASLKVTETTELSEAKVVDVIRGGSLISLTLIEK